MVPLFLLSLFPVRTIAAENIPFSDEIAINKRLTTI